MYEDNKSSSYDDKESNVSEEKEDEKEKCQHNRENNPIEFPRRGFLPERRNTHESYDAQYNYAIAEKRPNSHEQILLNVFGALKLKNDDYHNKVEKLHKQVSDGRKDDGERWKELQQQLKQVQDSLQVIELKASHHESTYRSEFRGDQSSDPRGICHAIDCPCPCPHKVNKNAQGPGRKKRKEQNKAKRKFATTPELPPESDKGWIKNNSKFWPRPTYEDLVDYLIHSKAYDGKEMKAFRAMYGYNYVQNGWMGDIWSNDQDNVTYVKSKISPSQPGVGRKDYETWIAIADKTDIKTGHCTCPAGNARSCSHISAIIYALSLAWKNGVSGETCTDKEQVWGKGAAHVLTHEPLSDMNFKRPSQTTLAATKAKKTEMVSDVTMETKQFLDHQDLEEFVDQSPMKIMWGTSGTMLHKILTAPVTQEKKAKEIPHQDHVVDSQIPVKIPLSCAKCQNFYEKFVLFEENKRKFIEDQTKLQTSDLWTDSRKLRITSSRVSNIPKTKRANPEKYVTNQIYPRFKGCAATQYGQKFEPIARQWFESNYDTQVRLTGLVISEEEPYIAASPDGVIDENTILETKCPTKPLSTLIQSGKYDVINLNGENVLSPKGKNGYFCQVQFAMFCTKSTLCKFVLWTPDQQILINVPFDRPYVEAILPRLREFYFNQLLVRLTEEFNANRLKLSAEYKLCCQ